MAAISDYLETQLIEHLFRASIFDKPSNISIALTSSVAQDNQDGSNIPEIPASVTVGNSEFSTNYARYDLGLPLNDGDDVWSNVGEDNNTSYEVYLSESKPFEFSDNYSPSTGEGTFDSLAGSGYFYPLYLNQARAALEDNNNQSSTIRFSDFPGVDFFTPRSNLASGVPDSAGLLSYEGNGFIKNNSQIVFEPAFRDWGWVSGIAILDSATIGNGNLLMYAPLRNPRYIYTGDQIKFNAQSLEISLN